MGSQVLSSVETLRFALAEEASAKEDMFYLVPQQLFCARSCGEHKKLDKHIACSPRSIDTAFNAIEGILQSNRGISAGNLRWFSRFPDANLLGRPIPSRNEKPGGTIYSVAHFLVCIAEHWQRLLHRCRARRYPLLVDELTCILGCFSPTLQAGLFLVSLKNIGLPSAVKSPAVWRVFDTDLRSKRLQPVRG